MKKRLIITLTIIVVFTVIILQTGFFVVEPNTALPDGGTVWYWRTNLDLPFISSPEGILLETAGSVSLPAKALTIVRVLSMTKDRVILELPYIDFLYDLSVR